MTDVYPIAGGKIKDIKWSYERGLLSTGHGGDYGIRTVVLVQLALTGAKWGMDGKQVTRATVSFGTPPSGGYLGHLVGEHGGYRMSVTLPLDDLPRIAAALTAPAPLLFEGEAIGDANKVTDFTVLSSGIVQAD